MRRVVLGAGRVGRAIVADLSADRDAVTHVVDVDRASLARLQGFPGVTTGVADLSNPDAVTRAVEPFDLAISAVPGHLGYRTLRAVIEAGKNAVDIAFFPEDPFSLDDLARSRGVTAIVDSGVAPGMSNLLVGHASSRLDRTDAVRIYVGGLPVVRRQPYEYAAVFSPIDVIEEYTRPARLVRDGTVVIRPALSDVESIDFPGIGTLEAFNTDGLRTLAETIDAPWMEEKTLRYPGHADRMRMLRETGFFGFGPIEIGGTMIRPIDLTSRLLFKQWELGDGEEDLTVMRILVDGVSAGAGTRIAFDLLDRYDPKTRTTSMARTTGYTATMMSRLLARGAVDGPGIVTPESIGRHKEHVEFLLAGLRDRGIIYRETTESLDTPPAV